MATLLLDRSDLEIRVIDHALALYENGTRTGTVPMKMLERLVVQGARTRLDTSVLTKLAEAGTATLLISPRASKRVAIVLGTAHNDAAVRLAQSQRVMDERWCLDWARALVTAKLSRQRALLLRAMTQRPDQRKPLHDAVEVLSCNLAQVSACDNPASLRGLEGSGARAHFQGLASVLPPALKFSGRNRRPPRDPVNACLSLAYTLLHFDAVRAAHVAGLDPLLGFYHRPSFGRESLACDLIEPLRPAVDEWVWHLFSARTLREDHFTQDRGACLLGKAGRGRFYAEWEHHAPAGRRWLRLRCATLGRILRAEGRPWLDDSDDEEV